MPLKRFLHILLVAVITAAIAYAIRSTIIEPRTMHEQCVAAVSSAALCAVRQALVMGFVWNLYAATSVVLGFAGLALRSRKLAWGAVVIGVLGAMLYRIEFAALGLLCGALALARAPEAPQQRQAGE